MIGALLTAGFATAQTLPSETDRLVSTGKLWFTVKYFHPALAYRDLDWDQALVDAVVDYVRGGGALPPPDSLP